MSEHLKFVQKTKIQSILTYFLLFLIPTQFGKHFWFPFSYVLGSRIDYLSPTIYLSDVIIVLLLLTIILKKNYHPTFHNNNYPSHESTPFPSLRKKLLWISIFPIAFLIVGIFLSHSPWLGLFSLLKGGELIFFGWFGGRFFLKHWRRSIFVMTCSLVGESILGFWQLYRQASVGGIFYFFGERTFSAATPGIANASINGTLVLRPYATFPHPNVFAGFLVIVMTLVLDSLISSQPFRSRLWYLLTLVIGTSALFSTLSRIAILVWFVTMGIYFGRKYYSYFQKKVFVVMTICLFALLLSLFIFLPTVFYRFFSTRVSDESILLRNKFTHDAILMIQKHPLFGVGLHNFLPEIPLFDKTASNIFSIQPVHNVFLLLVAELGIPLTTGLCVLLVFLIRRLYLLGKHQAAFSFLGLLLLGQVIVLGLFDHYWLTLQQGQMLLSLLFGILVTI